MSARTLLLPLALLALACAGCATKRTLTITSTPPGASVRLDERLVGETPVTIEFLHYGLRRITLYREGFFTRSERVAIEAPWWAAFPLDFISEVLLPFGWKDKHLVHFNLTAGHDELTRPDLRTVLERAEVLRRAGPGGPQDLPPVRVTRTQPAQAPATTAADPEPPR